MNRAPKIILYLLLAGTAAVMLTPMVWLLAASLKGDPVKGPNTNKLLRYYKDLHKSLDKQANQARLPDKFRSYP